MPSKRELAWEMRRHMTPAEAALWAHLRDDRLGGYHFRRQHVLAGLILDFYCHAARLVVEADGPVHEGQRDCDEERDRILRAMGLFVLRFPNEQILNDTDSVLARILAVARARTNP